MSAECRSKRRESILRDERTWQATRERVERVLESPAGAWVAGGVLLANMFAVGYIERL